MAQGVGAYNFKSWQLDALARWTLAEGRPRDALELFKLNAEVFPASSGVAQGVAEGYAQLNDRIIGDRCSRSLLGPHCVSRVHSR
jgi:hypothetical protein